MSTVTVNAFGAKGDGVTDDTAAFQAAANSTPARTIIVPAGVYIITQTILISNSAVRFVGEGPNSVIQFQPTANAPCFKFFSSTAALIGFCRIEGLAFSSTDTAYVKTVIEIIDAEQFTVSDIYVSAGGWNDATNSCIGILIEGRQSVWLEKITIFADRPVVIAKNPKSTISADHFHFQDCYLVAESNANPCITIQDGVNITNFTADGEQAWALGTYGLYFVSLTSTVAGYSFAVHNARWEQATNANGYMIYIASNAGFYGVEITNCYASGIGTKGYYFRSINGLRALGITYSLGGEALNVDATVRGEISGFFNTQSATIINSGFSGVLNDYSH